MHEISFLHLNKHKFHLYLFVNDILNIALVMRNYPPLLLAAGHEFVPGATLVQSNITYNIKLYLNSNFRVANKLISSS